MQLSKCTLLKVLPESLWTLSGLLALHLGGTGIEELSSAAAALSSLKILDLSQCANLASLGDGICALLMLEVLDLKCCGGLRGLPEGIGCLSSLLCLDLEGCNALAELPEGVSRLRKLQRLGLDGCGALTAVPSGLVRAYADSRTCSLQGMCTSPVMLSLFGYAFATEGSWN